jgi:N-acetylneuraminic acid mutarotase
VADFPHRLGYETAAAHAGRVYVFGGEHVRDDEYLATSDELHVYSPRADRWRALPRSGRERELAPGAFIGDRLHVVAGTDESFHGTSTHQVYDVSSRTWTTAAPFPRNLMTTAMATLGRDLVTVGGCASLGSTCGAVADAYRYHSATDTWTRLPDYPERVGFLSCGGINGVVYCSGGARPDYAASPGCRPSGRGTQ